MDEKIVESWGCKISDLPQLCKAREIFPTVSYFKDDFVFEILENKEASLNSDKYKMRLNGMLNSGYSSYVIDLGTHPTVEGALDFFKNNFLIQDEALVERVTARAQEIPVIGNDEDIKTILQNYNKNFLIKKIVDANNGFRIDDIDKIQKFEFEILGHSDFNYVAVSKENAGYETNSSLLPKGTKLEDIVGHVDAYAIKAVIERAKMYVAEKNENGYWKKHPFNKIDSIVLNWSEQTADENVEFKNLADLQAWFEKNYSKEDILADGTYKKNKVSFRLKNDIGDDFDTSIRFDVSVAAYDFNPFRENVFEYLSRDLGYNLENSREMSDGSEVYVDFSNYDPKLTQLEENENLPFWNYEYRHNLRGLFPSYAQEIIKEKWQNAGLELSGVSNKHEEIINEVMEYGIHNPLEEFNEAEFLNLDKIPSHYRLPLLESAKECVDEAEDEHLSEVVENRMKQQMELVSEEFNKLLKMSNTVEKNGLKLG